MGSTVMGSTVMATTPLSILIGDANALADEAFKVARATPGSHGSVLGNIKEAHTRFGESLRKAAATLERELADAS